MAQANEYLNNQFLAKYWNKENVIKPQKAYIQPVPTRLHGKVKKNEGLKIENKNIYTNMYKLASNSSGAVWEHRATGKRLKIPKQAKRRAS